MKPVAITLVLSALVYLSNPHAQAEPASDGSATTTNSPPSGNSSALATPSSEKPAAEGQPESEFYRLIKEANSKFGAGKMDEAKKIYQAAYDAGKKDNVKKPDLAVALSDIALIDKLAARYEEAQDRLMDALPLAGDDQSLVSFLQLRISSVMRARGNMYGAVEKAKASAEIRRKLDPGSLLLAQSLNNVAVLCLEQKNDKEALDFCDQAMAALKTGGHQGTAEEFAVQSTRAACLSEAGDYEGARKLLVQVLADQEKTFGSESAKLSSTLNNLAMTFCKQSKYGEAEPYLCRALVAAQASKPEDLGGVADASANLGDLYARMGESAKAETNFKKAIECAQTIHYRRLLDIKSQYQSFLAGELRPEKSNQSQPGAITSEKPAAVSAEKSGAAPRDSAP